VPNLSILKRGPPVESPLVNVWQVVICVALTTVIAVLAHVLGVPRKNQSALASWLVRSDADISIKAENFMFTSEK
jgi:hypothetical protein